jgi:hypothetical protein
VCAGAEVPACVVVAVVVVVVLVARRCVVVVVVVVVVDVDVDVDVCVVLVTEAWAGTGARARSVAGLNVGTAVPWVPATSVAPKIHSSTSPGLGTSPIAPSGA